jgi:hypothetical protein
VPRRRASRFPEGSLGRAAEEWLARGRTQKLSVATEAARRQDLATIAGRLAEQLERPMAEVAPGVEAYGSRGGVHRVTLGQSRWSARGDQTTSCMP